MGQVKAGDNRISRRKLMEVLITFIHHRTTSNLEVQNLKSST